MRTISLSFIILLISTTGSYSQNLLREQKERDSAGLVIAFIVKDSASHFNIDETTYFVDSAGSLVMVKHWYGENSGWVNSWLQFEVIYYFKENELVKISRKSMDRTKINTSPDIYFNEDSKRKMKKRLRKHLASREKFYLNNFKQLADDKNSP